MFEKIGRIAEHAATNVSRRQFLGRLGRAAMYFAAATSGLLVLGPIAEAAPRLCGINSIPECVNVPQGTPCANGAGRCKFFKNTGICGCTAYRG